MYVQAGSGSWSQGIHRLLAVGGSFIAIGCWALGAGCTNEDAGPKSCNQAVDCGIGQRCDSETRRCVPGCSADNHCPRDTATRCDQESGECVPAEFCDASYNCGTTPGHDYCSGGVDCVCVADASAAEKGNGAKGICWRPAQLCEPCRESVECGQGLIGSVQAECKTFKVGEEEQGVCLALHGRRCPPGMLPVNEAEHPELAGFCEPQGGDCGALELCRSDADCTSPSLPTCDPIRQVCVPGCSFDLVSRETLGCSPRQVCNANPQWVDPGVLASCETYPLYGLGSCSSPCEDDAECQRIDPSFVCTNDGAGKRCRPSGCMDDVECKSGRPGFNGFCDLKSGTCTYDACRLGPDLALGCGTSETYADCLGGWKCVGDEGAAFGGCVRLDCIEAGGTQVACDLGNLCAGAPYHDPITFEPLSRVVEPPAGVQPGTCFGMELEPWCGTSCEEAADCLGGPIDYPDSPNDCTSHGLRDNVCFWGCEYWEDCPAGWTCSSNNLRTICGSKETGPGLQLCASDDDCATGSSCVVPIVAGLPLDKGFKVCECTESGACGAGFQCNEGIGTASLNRSAPGFLEVKARYCSDSTPCGETGSCEWFGDMNDSIFGPGTNPVSVCGNAPPEMEGASAVCPAVDMEGKSSRPGKLISDMTLCVHTSVCQPGFVPSDPADPQSERVCRVL